MNRGVRFGAGGVVFLYLKQSHFIFEKSILDFGFESGLNQRGQKNPEGFPF
jgi:hypothetical protein